MTTKSKGKKQRYCLYSWETHPSPVLTVDEKIQEMQDRRDREFWRMIGDAIKAKNEDREFYPNGYWLD